MIMFRIFNSTIKRIIWFKNFGLVPILIGSRHDVSFLPDIILPKHNENNANCLNLISCESKEIQTLAKCSI